MKIFKYIFLAAIITVTVSCDDLLEIEPKGEIIADEALQTPQDMQELLNSAYDALRGDGGDFFGGRVQAISEVMSDNIDGSQTNLNNADFRAYYNKTSTFFTGYTQNMFDEPHYVIYRANVLLKNLDQIEGLSQAEQDRIAGEAKFLRAICYFELVRLFAHPYGYTPENTHLGVVVRTEPSAEAKNRNTVAEVYEQIVSDLSDAAASLPASNGVYADSWAAKAYLAKVYFFMHDYEAAFNTASDVLNNGPHAFNPDAEEYQARYSPESTNEAIFKMVSNPNDHRGTQLSTHFRSDAENPPTLRISREMYELATADGNDLRGGWYRVDNEGAENEAIFITKYDSVNYFDVPLMHITELKLIRGEAGLEMNTSASISTAVDDINDIRTRAGLTPISSSAGQASLLNTVREEKRKELVTEGQRFHDLRRRGAAGESDLRIRNSAWDCPGMAIQFPDTEIAGAGGTDVFTPNIEGGC